jgi:hypothetical protein
MQRQGRAMTPVPQAFHLSLSRRNVHLVFSNRSQLFVGFRFLVQCLLQNGRYSFIPKPAGQASGSSVPGDLIVLHSLSGADKSCISNFGRTFSLDQNLSFLNQPFRIPLQ